MEAVLVSPAVRDYELRHVRQQAQDPRNRRKRPAKLSSRLITAAYRHLVAPYFTRHEPSRPAFIAHTVPYLVRNTSPAVTAILSGVWFRKHGKGSYGAFMGEVMQAIATAERPCRPRQPLKTQRQADAMHVAVHLQSLEPAKPLLLPSRELQLRLLLPTPMTAWRILQRLVAMGRLQMVDPGISRPAASKAGIKATAATYRITEEDTRS
jgi:hypothetical protein